jgi:hypothetical protein
VAAGAAGPTPDPDARDYVIFVRIVLKEADLVGVHADVVIMKGLLEKLHVVAQSL